MKSKFMILLRTLLLSTSSLNSIRFCKDKKKRGKIIGGIVGSSLLYAMLMAYCIATCYGYGKLGLTSSMPALCAITICALAFLFTVFRTNGYLFGFKEYDMLMALPFGAKDIAGCRFLYMYEKSMPWYVSVSFSVMIVYGVFAGPSVIVYPIWIVLSLMLPIIPMLAAAFIGFIIAKIGSGFKNKTIVQTVLSTVFVLFVIASRFFIEDMFRNDKTEEVLLSASEEMDRIGDILLPAKWFAASVVSCSISDMLLLIGSSVILFIIVFALVGRSYRKINSALKTHTSSGKFVMTDQKKRSVIGAIVFKEFKRMTGSAVYMTNACIGEIMCVIAGIAILFVNVDSLLNEMTKGAPVNGRTLAPAIPLIIYIFLGMVATTAFTPSLEGKNYWIVQSLPISKRTLYLGKILFNLCLTVPFMIFSTITFSIAFKVSFVSMILYIVFGMSLCIFSSCWGCVCGIKHMKLDWENEVEVIKQSAAVAIYLLPNMFACMALIVLDVALGMRMNGNLIIAIQILPVSALSALCYLRVVSLSRK
ncbi:MAG: hypothetical protein K6G57_03675 [Lachnospiraceae bacterium]|nr:hypothetical protein [Lachnospiraceae bacterium]